MQIINSLQDVSDGLTALAELDDRLARIIDAVDDVPLRRHPANFASLAHIVTGQLLSTSAAAAIFKRLEETVQPLDAETLLRTDESDLLKAGLSRAKVATLRAVAEATAKGLNLEQLALAPASEAHKSLCKIKGIGRWSADVFLVFCAGHTDIFPSGDLALRVATQTALNLPDRPEIRDLDAIAEKWAPWRSIAARLLWAWYRVQKQGRETTPL
ncbi:DNA-3-methyladenine glycosylase family protein [Roseibium sediminis]|uniref:DNA-3-methyladenine glycosylase family protein n=1 Tax=Roseibium sediminis TaxID=1775174 RepID=UPI00123D6367|nr:DNA-3-methyladenine glycosylase [Roseibium sediminis]